MSKLWSDKEEKALMMLVNRGYTPEEVSEKMNKMGYNRTAGSVLYKWGHLTGIPYPEKEDNKTSLVMLLLGLTSVAVVFLLLKDTGML